MRTFAEKCLVVLALPLAFTAGSVAAGEAWLGGGNPACLAPQNQRRIQLATGPLGGFYVAWADDRNEGSPFAQFMTFAGEPLWGQNGSPISDDPAEQYPPRIVPDGAGGIIAAWADARNGPESDIYAQRLGPSGSPGWGREGVPVCGAEGEQVFPLACPDEEGGAYVFWWDSRGEGGCDLRAQRLDAAGAARWNPDGIVVCAAARFRYSFLRPAAAAAPDGAGGTVVAWEDYRSSETEGDVYAQRLDDQGSAAWTDGGIAVCSAPSAQWSPAVVPDGESGAIVTWHDFRGGAESDIFAQRLDAAGTALWPAQGVSVCTAPGSQFDPVLAPDGSGGAVVAWIDLRSKPAHGVFAQRLDAGGSPLWDAGGVSLGADARHESLPDLAPDGGGGAIVAWHEVRGGADRDIFAQRVTGAGAPVWGAGGVAVCVAPGDQRNAVVAPDGSGGAIAAWEDCRYGEGSDVFAQRVTESGVIVGTFLRRYSASVRGGAVDLRWETESALPASDFEVARTRAEDGSAFAPLPGRAARSGAGYEFLDRDVTPGTSYRYRVLRATASGYAVLFETGSIDVPAVDLGILACRPNPFRASTVIEYDVPLTTPVELAIYSCSGALVARLRSEVQMEGRHAVAWDGRKGDGTLAAPGVYFAGLRTQRGFVSRKIVRVK